MCWMYIFINNKWQPLTLVLFRERLPITQLPAKGQVKARMLFCPVENMFVSHQESVRGRGMTTGQECLLFVICSSSRDIFSLALLRLVCFLCRILLHGCTNIQIPPKATSSMCRMCQPHIVTHVVYKGLHFPLTSNRKYMVHCMVSVL